MEAYSPEVDYNPCVQEVKAGASEFQNDPELQSGRSAFSTETCLEKIVWLCKHLIPALRRERQVDLHELYTNLAYIVKTERRRGIKSKGGWSSVVQRT